MSEVGEEEWRRRFGLFALARLSAVALVLLGVAVALTGLVRPGGWPVPGAILVILGAIEGLLVPRLIRRRWEQK